MIGACRHWLQTANFGLQMVLLGLMVWLSGQWKSRGLYVFALLTIIIVFLSQSILAIFLVFTPDGVGDSYSLQMVGNTLFSCRNGLDFVGRDSCDGLFR